MAKQTDGRNSIDQSRRSLLTGVAGAGAFAMLAMFTGPFKDPVLAALAAGQRAPSAATDVAFLNEAIQIEQKAINTYRAALQADLIKKPEFVDVAVDFVDDHGQHRDAIARTVRVNYRGTMSSIENLGTFPIPDAVLKGKEADVLRYALMLETIASKTYLEAVSGKLATEDARGLIASIMPVETEHVAVYRTVLMVVLKDKGLKDDKQVVPYPFFNEQPMPELNA